MRSLIYSVLGLLTLGSLVFAKGPGQVKIHLDKPQVISGVPIAAGDVTLWGAWEQPEKRILNQGVLSEDFETQGFKLTKGSSVSFNYSFEAHGFGLGDLSQFVPSHAMRISKLSIPAGKEVELSGRFIRLTLAKNVNVLGYPAAQGSVLAFVCRTNPCTNEPNLIERVTSVLLNRDLSINTIVFPKGSRLNFLPETGVPTSVELPKDQVFQGLAIQAGFVYEGKFYPQEVGLHPNGKIASGFLSQATEFQTPRVKISAAHFTLSQDGTLGSGKLAEATVIDGIPLAAEWVSFTQFGGLETGVLERAGLVNGYELPKGARFQLNNFHNLVMVNFDIHSAPVTFNGVSIEQPSVAKFTASGKVSNVEFLGVAHFGGLTLKERVYFSESGKLLYFQLSEAAEMHGLTIRPYPGIVQLYESGALQSVALMPGNRINGYLVRVRTDASYDVSFYENGQVTAIPLAEAVTINGVSLKAGGGVGYYENGSLNYVYLLTKNTLVQSIPAAEDSSVAYDEQGVVKYVSKLYEDVTVNGVVFKAGQEYRRP